VIRDDDVRIRRHGKGKREIYFKRDLFQKHEVNESKGP
jgi:hypothetical protein